MELIIETSLMLIVGFVLAFYYWSTSTYNHWKSLGIPGPKPAPLIGSMSPFFFERKSFTELINDLYKKWKNEPFFGIYNIKTPILIVKDPDLIRNILIKDFHVFPGRGIAVTEDEPLAQHLFIIQGHKWKVMRSKLTPIFTTGKLKHMVDLIIECANHFEEYLHIQVGTGKVIECHDVAAKFTTDVIGSCAFGINMNAIDKDDSEFRKMGKKIFEPSIVRILVLMLREIVPKLLKLLDVRVVPKVISSFFMKSIRETMELREKENFVRHDLVDILREIKKKQNEIDFEVTENLLASQCFVFFIAGFETSSTTISFALYELALVPEIQEKLRTEIIETLKKHNGQLSYEIINEMKFLNMVVQETLRKNPAVPLLVRKSIQPYKLPGTDITLPAGTTIQIPAYSIHHDEKYYAKPEVFDPERFNDNEFKNVYLPFGDGPKNCIGARFALYQTKLGIITILKNYRVSPSELTEVPYKIHSFGLVLTAKGGNNLKLEPLN